MALRPRSQWRLEKTQCYEVKHGSGHEPVGGLYLVCLVAEAAVRTCYPVTNNRNTVTVSDAYYFGVKFNGLVLLCVVVSSQIQDFLTK